MKQILQSLKDGITEIADVPCPRLGPKHLLIQTSHTLVSVGTERMLIEFGKANWIGKVRQQPEKVRMVFDKFRVDGLFPTIQAVQSKLDQPLPLGYCNFGRVIDVSAGVSDFTRGDRVVSNGWHAEVVNVPANLCAKVPDEVDDEQAPFTVLGAIALQGIRLAQPTLGEGFVVTGLGVIGLLAVQLLHSSGCRVLGIDFDSNRLSLARKFGAETVDLSAGQDPVSAAMRFSRGRGVDAVLITASTDSSEPVHQAAEMCRKRGRIVLVGVAGLELSRSDFYEKELTFQVSCSYGPGRYDPIYEQQGHDYPVGFVRWTEQRNFEAILDMLATGRLSPKHLISHRFPIHEASKAYELINSSAPSLGVLLDFECRSKPEALPKFEGTGSRSISVTPAPSRGGANTASSVAFIGSGSFATSVLIPAFKAAGADLSAVVSQAGVSSLHAARKFGFSDATTDLDAVLARDDLAAVVIGTRHHSHADLACRALDAGKHVFVEKPLALSLTQLTEIEQAYVRASNRGVNPIVMVGFNRRFAPHTQQVKNLLSGVPGPKTFIVTVNAGAIPANHWVHDPEIGGGRIIGEGCHFIDLLRFLVGAPIASYSGLCLDKTEDTATLNLGFADGSVGSVHYFSNGSRKFEKERLEVFADGRMLQLHNFRKISAFDWPGFRGSRAWSQDKGHRACVAEFMRAVRQVRPSPIAFHELVEVSRVSIELAAALREKPSPVAPVLAASG